MRTAALIAMLPLVAPAHAEPPEPSAPAIKAATAWMAATLDPKVAATAPTKQHPLHYLINSPTKACRAVKTGQATSKATADQIKACLIETWRSLADTPPGATSFRVWDAEETFGAFDRKYQKDLRAAAKDATIVLAQYLGNGLTMNASIVVSRDGSVRAIWMDRGEFE